MLFLSLRNYAVSFSELLTFDKPCSTIQIEDRCINVIFLAYTVNRRAEVLFWRAPANKRRTLKAGVSQPKMRNLFRELLLAQSKKVKSERFAALNASVTGGKLACPFVVRKEKMNHGKY